MAADARKDDGSWSVCHKWHKDLFPPGGEIKMLGMGENELIETVKRANGEAIKVAKMSLLHMGQAGLALIALKHAAGHGIFKMHLLGLEIEPRTAQNYMMIARNYETVSHLRGVRDALQYIREATTRASAAQKEQDAEWTIQGGILPLDVGNTDNPELRPTAAAPAAVILDAVIVETSAHYIEQEPQHEEPEYDAAAIRLAAEHGVTPAEVVAAGEFHSATTRLSVLENKIEDGISKLKSEGMILPTVLSMLPHLTKSEIKSLIETLNTRWT